MKLKQALEQQADIVVSNDTEKADVINLLHLNGVESCNNYETNEYPHLVHLFRNNVFVIYYDWGIGMGAGYPQIPAAQFIAANSLADTTTNNGITDDHGAHSTNVL